MAESDGWVPMPDDTYVGALGALFKRPGDEGTEIGLSTTERHCNLSGNVHGGVLMTLFDRCAGLLAHAAMPGSPIATASMTVNFTRSVKPGAFIRISGRLRKAGHTAVFADCDAWVGDRLVGTASGLLMRVQDGAHRRSFIGEA
ncbi:PaaI family thioesterase [Oricola sp.]|uniref:PaaI family thioesterase n=1 Tax=Oricola sp. TaxID=1979950 RepID=UPI0025D0AB11|nr:PaaI family thioesterase [Oricola sp.]MCI5075382.1 PaaI family thioesterase [Oricola sp.]